MKEPRVFVVNVPVSREGDRVIDVRPAARFGELVYVFPPGNPPLDPGHFRSVVEEKMVDFGEGDFLLPVGNIVAIVAASAFAADRTDGRFRVLHWHGRDREYVPVTLDVFRSHNQEPENDRGQKVEAA